MDAGAIDRTERHPEDDPLEVAVIGGNLVISIGVRTLAFAIVQKPGEEDVIRVTDPLAAAKEIARELSHEEEDGTTEVHRLLDKAAYDAWENGGEGFGFDDDGPDDDGDDGPEDGEGF